MKLRTLLKFSVFGIFVGSIYGLFKGVIIISSHKYLNHGLYNSILLELTRNINQGILSGFAISLLFILLVLATSLILQKFFFPYLRFKIIRKGKLAPMFKRLSLGVLLIYLSFKIIEYFVNPDYDFQSLLFQLLIVIFFLFFILRLEKIDFQSLKLILINLSRSGGIKITGIAIFAFLILTNTVTISQKLFSSPSKPNILLIVADALRADHLGCYGYDRETSPHIDKFAANALVFENAITNAPWTKPSMGSLFTSQYPHEHSAVYWTESLPDKCLTLAEVFKNRNYTTFAIQTNPAITENHNFGQGFQFYEEIILEKGEVVTSNFNTWVKKHKKKPFFAYLHYMDTHVPYNAPKEFSQIFGLRKDTLFSPGDFLTIDVRILGEIGLSQQDKKNIISLYDGAINYFDYNFKKILDHLNNLEILNNTIIILTSDHGEEFWEHNGFAHGHTLYNEVIQVPLVINYHKSMRSKRIKSYAQLIDLFPTILDMAGIKNHFDTRGNNLVELVLKNKDMNNEIFFEGVLFGAEKKGIIKDGWKLIENTGLKYNDTLNQIGDLTKYRYPEHKKGFELYNINNDFHEKQNLIMKYPQIENRLKGHLKLFKIKSPNFVDKKKPDLKKKLKDLKSLGYIK